MCICIYSSRSSHWLMLLLTVGCTFLISCVRTVAGARHFVWMQLRKILSKRYFRQDRTCVEATELSCLLFVFTRNLSLLILFFLILDWGPLGNSSNRRGQDSFPFASRLSRGVWAQTEINLAVTQFLPLLLCSPSLSPLSLSSGYYSVNSSLEHMCGISQFRLVTHCSNTCCCFFLFFPSLRMLQGVLGPSQP